MNEAVLLCENGHVSRAAGAQINSRNRTPRFAALCCSAVSVFGMSFRVLDITNLDVAVPDALILEILEAYGTVLSFVRNIDPATQGLLESATVEFTESSSAQSVGSVVYNRFMGYDAIVAGHPGIDTTQRAQPHWEGNRGELEADRYRGRAEKPGIWGVVLRVRRYGSPR